MHEAALRDAAAHFDPAGDELDPVDAGALADHAHWPRPLQTFSRLAMMDDQGRFLGGINLGAITGRFGLHNAMTWSSLASHDRWFNDLVPVARTRLARDGWHLVELRVGIWALPPAGPVETSSSPEHRPIVAEACCEE